MRWQRFPRARIYDSATEIQSDPQAAGTEPPRFIIQLTVQPSERKDVQSIQYSVMYCDFCQSLCAIVELNTHRSPDRGPAPSSTSAQNSDAPPGLTTHDLSMTARTARLSLPEDARYSVRRNPRSQRGFVRLSRAAEAPSLMKKIAWTAPTEEGRVPKQFSTDYIVTAWRYNYDGCDEDLRLFRRRELQSNCQAPDRFDVPPGRPKGLATEDRTRDTLGSLRV